MDKRDVKTDLALLKAATPGPWKHDDRSGCTAVRTGETPGLNRDHEDVICYSSKGAAYDEKRGCWDMDEQTRKDFAFIAACPEMVEHWLNRAVEAEGREDALIEEIQHLRDDVETLRSALRDAVGTLAFYRDNICWFDGWRMSKDLEKVGPGEAEQAVAIANEALEA
jgi:hypothetical protein